ncbi:NAD(P)-binding Rossmann-fold superfamily protein [Euphorbia peplus]|nr:NAD(P)-binding Rossmann-fold superfamily protein [Euphorbia peplus]
MEGENSVWRNKRWSLKGMTALVTGGTRGIGHAIVEELARFEVVVHTCSRNQTELDKCLQQWQSKGFKVTGSVCDASNREQREKLMETVSTIFHGKLNILVNNVGIPTMKEAVSQKAEDISMIMSTNFESCFHLCQLAHPLLKASGYGSIVNISSIASSVVIMPGSIYAASKGAMNQITKELACEWANDGIRVNAVLPGVIQTSYADSLPETDLVKYGSKGLVQFISRIPAKRTGKPEEISSIVAYLCFPTAAYITGQSITVDGGFTINAVMISS